MIMMEPERTKFGDAHYLRNSVGDTEIRKGEGMQLGQLIQNTSQNWETNSHIQTFDADELKEAFQLNDMTPVELPPRRDKDKDREHEKHKHKDRNKDKEKDRDRKKDSKKQHDKHKSSKLDEMGGISGRHSQFLHSSRRHGEALFNSQ